MNPEEIQEAIDQLNQRAKERIGHLQQSDPALQGIYGQIMAFQAVLAEKKEVPGAEIPAG